jgi:hypothetical protein
VIDNTRWLKTMVLALTIVQPLPGCAAERGNVADGKRSDAKIAANVKTAIDQYPALGPPNLIYVISRDDVVYLSGLAKHRAHHCDC